MPGGVARRGGLAQPVESAGGHRHDLGHALRHRRRRRVSRSSVTDRQRRHQHDDVAEGRTHTPRRRAAWQTAKPVRSPTGATSMPVMVPIRRISTHPVVGREPGRQLADPLADAGRPLDRPALGHQVEVRDRGRAAQRVRGVGVAVEEGACLGRCAEERLVDVLARQHRRQRQVAAGQALAAGHQVGRDPGVLDRPHAARSRPMPVATSSTTIRAPNSSQSAAHAAQERRVVGEHAAGGLHHRLDDDRAHLARRRRRVRCASRRAPRPPGRPATGRASAGRERTPCVVSSRIGRYVAWNRSMPPTLTAPSVSPWYPSATCR